MIRISACIVLAGSFMLTANAGEEIKSGPEKIGAFNVKAITGELKGKTLCYV